MEECTCSIQKGQLRRLLADSFLVRLSHFKIERYHPPLAQFEKYINPSLDAYGREGLVTVTSFDHQLLTTDRVLDVGFSKTWERGFSDFLEAAYASGVPRNLDVNSGDPTGISVNAMTTSNGRRVTASSAYLSDVPSNLTVLTDAMVEKIIFDGKRAVGVKLEHKTSRSFETRLQFIDPQMSDL